MNMTPFLHLSPQLALQSLFSIGKILKSFPGTVRIHSAIAIQFPCSRLWYFLRGSDIHGQGVIKFDLDLVATFFMGVAKSTVYQWLREGKNLGFFRSYRKDRKSGKVKVFLGGLHAVCLRIGLENWGKVATVPIAEITSFFNFRCTAAALSTHALQHESRYAAKLKSKKRVVHPHEIFKNSPSCQKSGKRGKGSVFHVSKRYVFCGSHFVPFGCTQESVGAELGRSSRSVRRYLGYLKVPRRQIAQSKAEYSHLFNQLQWEGIGVEASTEKLEGSSVSTKRMFKYAGKTWLLRCNIYQINYRLNTMKAARNKLGKLIKRKIAPAETAPRSCCSGAITSSYNSLDNLENTPEISGTHEVHGNRVK